MRSVDTTRLLVRVSVAALLWSWVLPPAVFALGWRMETVAGNDPSMFYHGSLHFDGSGLAAISYHAGLTGDLTLARQNPPSWDIETVDAGSGTFRGISLDFDGSGDPAISYGDYSSNNLVKFARWNGSSWDIEVVDALVLINGLTSLALDGRGYPAIGYTDHASAFPGLDLKVARWNGSSWDIEILDPGTDRNCGSSSLALDDHDRPAIAYWADDMDGSLHFTRWDGSSWNTDLVDLAEAGSSLALDVNGDPVATLRLGVEQGLSGSSARGGDKVGLPLSQRICSVPVPSGPTGAGGAGGGSPVSPR